MHRINVSRTRTVCNLVVIALCAGCTTMEHNSRKEYVDHVNLSDAGADGVATIQGSSRTFLGQLGEYCWIASPATAMRVTLNAGDVDIFVKCEGIDVVEEEVVMFVAAFRFEALAGHVYETNSKCKSCIQLVDVNTSEVITESSTHRIPSQGVRRSWMTAEDRAIDDKARAETRGMPPDRIMSAQRLLNSLGYDCGEPSGMVDGRTRNAVTEYQFDNEMEITGWVNEILVTHLEARIANK